MLNHFELLRIHIFVKSLKQPLNLGTHLFKCNLIKNIFRRQYERNLINPDALVIPSEYQIAKEIEVQYLSMRNEFLTNHKSVASQVGFACTFDFSQAGPDYGVLTFHYIDNNW